MVALKKTWEFTLDILFPPICLNCKKYLEKEEKPNLICNSCLDGIDIYKTPFRPRPDLLLGAATSYENPAVRELIHYFKYEAFLQARKPLGEILIKYLSGLDMHLQNFVVVPVPLHPSRRHKRGFNQSEILAEIIAKYFGLQLETSILKRIKETKPQIEMRDYDARKKNIKGSFEIMANKASLIKDAAILLVDDVYTSGATISEAVKTLKRGGAKEIITVVVAKTS